MTATAPEESKGPAFYAHRTWQSLIRTSSWADADIWTQEHGWRSADPGGVMEDLYSPQWRKITLEEAQVKINRWGGGPDDALAPVSGAIDYGQPTETPA